MSRSFRHTPRCGDRKSRFAKRLANRTARRRIFRADDRAVFELVESGYVHCLERLCKNVVEASLRDAAGERHLSAFEADPDAAAGSGLLSLMAAASGLAVACTVASAFTLCYMRGALSRVKIVQIHSSAPPYSSVTEIR